MAFENPIPYEGKKSKPEWGVNISRKNMSLLHPFAFDTTVKTLAGKP